MWVVRYMLRESVVDRSFARKSEAEEFADKIGERLIEIIRM